ncbi:MAG: hypothetical protein JO347_03475 [Candidatus Eremiobacteraeota bacterium]|nr:hypothetical protein [Candidatus Eremiobacteraeota bacterium]
MRVIFRCLAIAALAVLTAVPVLGAPTNRGAAPRGVLAGSDGITVSIVDISDGAALQGGGLGAAVVDLGTVSANARTLRSGVAIHPRSRSYVVATTIGLRATGSNLGGTASLQAFLDAELPGLVVRLDGVMMGRLPRTFARLVPLGATTPHRLEIEIPNNFPVAQLPSEVPLEFGAAAD